MAAADLSAIKERWARVMPGPWQVRKDLAADAQAIVSTGTRFGQEVVVAVLPVQGRPDAEAIARAREDVPWLVAEVERLRGLEAEVADLRARLAALETVAALAREVEAHAESLAEAAAREEREACARLAEHVQGAPHTLRTGIAAAIRARGR